MTRLESRTAVHAPTSFGSRMLDDDAPRLAPRVAYQVARALDTVLLWHERVQQRRQLLQLDDAMLRDIGVVRADALSEASKPFWRA